MDQSVDEKESILESDYMSESQIDEESSDTVRFLRLLAKFLERAKVDERGKVEIEDWPSLRDDAFFDGDNLSLYAWDSPECREALLACDQNFRKFSPDTPTLKEPLGERGSGVSVKLISGVKPMLRGHVECINTIMISGRARSPLVMAFISIAGLDDKIDRDNHGFGYHYHYCNKKGLRSDTILCFDTAQFQSGVKCPLFWERHAEKGAKFDAKASLWGPDKRSSVHTAVSPELTKRGALSNFRRPSNDAQDVWPRHKVVSPRP